MNPSKAHAAGFVAANSTLLSRRSRGSVPNPCTRVHSMTMKPREYSGSDPVSLHPGLERRTFHSLQGPSCHAVRKLKQHHEEEAWSLVAGSQLETTAPAACRPQTERLGCCPSGPT